MNDHEPILSQNRRVYDAMADAENPLCRPAKAAELRDPLGTVDAAGWLGESIAGQDVLCLAAGGGRQSSLYAAAGAKVTVVDISPAMLELDRRMAAQHGFSIRLFEASMDLLPMLRDGEFDLVIHPVSTCYVPDLRPVFAEVARVTRGGGLYVSQHKQPTSLQSSMQPDSQGRYLVEHRYYRNRPIPAANHDDPNSRRLRERGAVEFLHRWETLVGGICRAGFVIEDLREPFHANRPGEKTSPGSFADRAGYLPPYVRIKARRKQEDRSMTPAPTLWLPQDGQAGS